MKGKAVEALKGAAEHSMLNVTFLFFLLITKDPFAMLRWLGDVLVSSVGALLFFSVAVLSIAYQASSLSRTMANDSAHAPRRRRELFLRIVKSSVEPALITSYLVLSVYAAITLMRTPPEDVAMRVPGHFLPEYFVLCFFVLLFFSWIIQVVRSPSRVLFGPRGGS